MAYQVEKSTGDIIISGFQNGIGDDPYSGFTDMRNVNITSVPGEAAVEFATQSVTQLALSGIVSSASGSTLTFSGAVGIANNMGIVFSASTLSGATVGILYLVGAVSGSTFKIYSDYGLSTQVSISGSGTGTFAVLTPALPKHFAKDAVGNYWMVDASGYVWSNTVTIGANNNWTPLGNIPNNNSNGNGLLFYQGTSTHGYLFFLSNGSIDYIQVTAPYTVVYQWNFLTGTTGSWSATPSQTLKTASGTANSHEALVPPDGKAYFCDANYIDRFFQTSPSSPFDPTSTATYTPDQTPLLPYNDIANCLTFLGTNLLVGGLLNCIYPWDRVSNQFNYPLLLAENVVSKMVTVNTNTFAFVGNRGRIYITNGTQAQLYKKIPDHISGTVEPYFQWGGACFNKNQLIFSALAKTNANGSITAYGGVWAVDLDTKAIRLLQKLSYGTYAGYASAIVSQTPTPISGTLQNITPQGTGLYIGWSDGVTGTGIDQTVTAPYTGGQSIIVSDMIPVGTLFEPTTSQQFEFKLNTPLLANETVELQIASSFSDYVNNTFTSLGTTSGSASATVISGLFPNKLDPQQWMLFKVILTGKSSNPSYNRLTQFRIKGGRIK